MGIQKQMDASVIKPYLQLPVYGWQYATWEIIGRTIKQLKT